MVWLSPSKGQSFQPVRDIKNETTNVKCCKKTLFNGALLLIYYFKNHFQPCFFILKALKDILQPFTFVNWWFRFLM